MPLVGGIFTRIYRWVDDRANNVEISDVRFDDEMDGMAEAFNKALYRDGQAPATGNISMGNNRLTNLADPQSDTDALNQRSADSRYGTSTAVRLTLTSGVAVTEADVAGAGTIYLTPDGSNTIGIWSGSAWVARAFTETSLALDATGHLANKNYDVFAFWDGSEVKIGSAPAWAGNTQRGTGSETSELEYHQGRLVNKNSVSLRNAGSTITTLSARRGLLVGGFRTTSVAGQTEDSNVRRFLSNVYGRTTRPMVRQETAASWTYGQTGGDVWRQANANAANKLEFFQCVGGDFVEAEVFAVAINSTTAARTTAVGIGLDNITANNATFKRVMSVPQELRSLDARYVGNPGIGYHYLSWLEVTGTNDTRTFYGNGLALTPTPVEHQSGISGSVVG